MKESSINLGCGSAKITDFINVDINRALNPDLVHDISQDKFPWDDETIDRITCFHTIEHISRDHHEFVLGEINRVLKIGAKLTISFPNSLVCTQNFLNNKWGMRDYWEKTICGRGTTIWDCHRSLIYVDDFIPFLGSLGFGKFRVIEEVEQPHNCVIQAEKLFSVIERTELLRKEVVHEH